MQQELDLIKQILDGNKSAFKQIVEQNKKMIYILAYNITRNQEDAEDLTQEVFLKAFRFLPNFKGESKFSTWLYKIALNTCKTFKQRTKNLESYNEIDENDTDLCLNSSFENPASYIESEQIKNRIEQALVKLSEKEKNVFVMRYYQELSFNEIETIMNLKGGTVRSLHFRAIKKMQKELSLYRNDIKKEIAYERL